MKENKWFRVVLYFFSAVCVFFGIQLVEFLGAVLHTGIEACWQGLVNRSFSPVVQAVNYCHIQMGSLDVQHLILQSALMTAVIWWMNGKLKNCRLSLGVLSFLIWMLVFVGLYEATSYIACLIQFGIDALRAGITSRMPDLTLKNTVSLARFENINYLDRLIEAYLVTRIWFFILRLHRGLKDRKIRKEAKKRERQVRREEQAKEARIKSRSERERRRREFKRIQSVGDTLDDEFVVDENQKA